MNRLRSSAGLLTCALVLAACGSFDTRAPQGAATPQGQSTMSTTSTSMSGTTTVQTTINFEEQLSEGMIVNAVSCGTGIDCAQPVSGAVNVYAYNPLFVDTAYASANFATIYDATCSPTGTVQDCSGDNPEQDDDGDLLKPALGNVLIINETPDTNSDGLVDPYADDLANADAAKGAYFLLDFSNFGTGKVDLAAGKLMTVLDTEEFQQGPSYVIMYSDTCGGTEVHRQLLPRPGNNMVADLVLDEPVNGVACMKVEFFNSGAIDNIMINAHIPARLEGCTPGYWKQPHHLDSWPETLMDTDLFDSVFGVDATLMVAGKGKPTKETDPTLLEALNAGGGGENALARHAVAALLNATNDEVQYGMTADAVIELVQNAYESGDFEAAKDTLVALNEMGCPLN